MPCFALGGVVFQNRAAQFSRLIPALCASKLPAFGQQIRYIRLRTLCPIDCFGLTLRHGIRYDGDEDTRLSDMPAFGADEILD